MLSNAKLSALAAALIVGLSSAGSAQKMKPAKPDHDVKEMQHAARDAQKDAAKAAKDAHKDAAKDARESREDAKDAAKAVKNDDAEKATKAEKATERVEHASFKSAREQSSRRTRGVKLTAAERQKFEATRKQYDAQYRDLEKQERDLDRNHQSDAAVLQKLEALRVQERTDLRAILTPSQQTVFDRNAAAIGTGKP